MYEDVRRSLVLSDEEFANYWQLVLKPRSITDAFYFDGYANSFYSAFRQLMLSMRYKAMVTFRLMQYAARRGIEIELSEMGGKKSTENSPTLGKTSKMKMLFWRIFQERCHRSLVKNYCMAFSPYVDVPSGFFSGSVIDIRAAARTKIGPNVKIGTGVRLVPSMKGGPSIEEGAVIWTGSTIMGAVTIGRQATVGANSLVVSDVPAGYTAMGVPAKLVFRKKVRPQTPPQTQTEC